MVRLSQAQKAQIKQDSPTCYVCDELGNPNADFLTYEDRWIQFDHWLAQGLIGDSQADLLSNIRPVHAAPDGTDPLAPGWDTSTRRNCHRGKSNVYTGQEWCDYIRIFRTARGTRFSDDLMAGRDRKSPAYRADIEWDDKAGTAAFRGQTYPVMLQRVGGKGEEWKSFSTVVPPSLLWTDDKVQSRSASAARLALFAWHLRANPLLTPILCRYSDGLLKVFDGNHRLSAFMLARKDHPVPVTIFEGPDPKRFLSVAADAHDSLTQLKYQYTDKALKFSALNEQELQTAQDHYGDLASEELAWHGLRPAEAKLRIIGRLTSRLDEAGGWRRKWKEAGLTDPSWNEFLATYAKSTPEAAPFSSPEYLREEEFENLSKLCQSFDEELFDLPEARDSLKTKWWKRAHARFAKALGQVVKHSLKTPDTPERPAYAPKWDAYVLGQIRKGVINWRESPAWRKETTANNEAEIDRILRERGFTESALM